MINHDRCIGLANSRSIVLAQRTKRAIECDARNPESTGDLFGSYAAVVENCARMGDLLW